VTGEVSELVRRRVVDDKRDNQQQEKDDPEPRRTQHPTAQAEKPAQQLPRRPQHSPGEPEQGHRSSLDTGKRISRKDAKGAKEKEKVLLCALCVFARDSLPLVSALLRHRQD